MDVGLRAGSCGYCYQTHFVLGGGVLASWRSCMFEPGITAVQQDADTVVHVHMQAWSFGGAGIDMRGDVGKQRRQAGVL